MTAAELIAAVIGAIPHRAPCDFPDQDCGCTAAEDRRAVVEALAPVVERDRQESISGGSGALPDVYRVGDRAPGTERSTLGALDPLIGQPKPRAGER